MFVLSPSLSVRPCSSISCLPQFTPRASAALALKRGRVRAYRHLMVKETERDARAGKRGFLSFCLRSSCANLSLFARPYLVSLKEKKKEEENYFG